MNLISVQFIISMIVTVILYYAVPKKYKNITLLAISMIVITTINTYGILYILFTILLSYFASKNFKSKNKKAIFISSLFINIAVLVLAKIILFQGNESILLPMGISYYTFQVISYLVDTYKGKYEHEKNFIKFALYMLYFPYLSIGPINRYDDFQKEINKDKKFNSKAFYLGVIRILWGISKKLIIANRIQIIIGTITGDTDKYIGAYSLLAMILYSVQLYCDFSGGIDIVLGFSKILQIRLIENFNLPYLSGSVKEFWRRWHISLSSWFRDYVYIPLGGSRCSNLRKSINILIVFTLSGLWHGINYMLWGFLHGLIMILENYVKIKSKIVNIIITFLFVSMLWSFYIWNDTILALKMMASVFTNFNYKDLITNFYELGVNNINLIVLIVAVLILIICEFKTEKLKEKIDKKSFVLKLSIPLIMLLIILVFGIYGIGFDANQFIYNKF